MRIAKLIIKTLLAVGIVIIVGCVIEALTDVFDRPLFLIGWYLAAVSLGMHIGINHK